MLVAFSIAVWVRRDRLDRYFLLLVLMWGAVCALAAVHVPIANLHPFLAGPRYFFYPLLLMTWAGLWIAAVSGPIVKSIIAAAYIAAVWFAVSYQTNNKYLGFTRRHDLVDWSAHAERCAQSKNT